MLDKKQRTPLSRDVIRLSRSQMTSISENIKPLHACIIISPSKHNPPQTGNAKNPPLNRPSKYKPLGGLYLENCPQIQRKTKKKVKFPSNCKTSPINFKTQISLRTLKSLHKPHPGTSEFYGLRLWYSRTSTVQTPLYNGQFPVSRQNSHIFSLIKTSIISLIRTVDIKSRPQRVNSNKLNLLITDSAVIR